MQVSENTDVMMRVHTGRDHQGAMLNQNGGARLQFRLYTDGWRGINPLGSDGDLEHQGQRKEDPGGA